MAIVGGNRTERSGVSNISKSSIASPEKIRELLNEGASSVDKTASSPGDADVSEVGGGQAPWDATNKEAFFSRVESYSCLKWAAKPRALSPLVCARYGWINVGCDMLKCCSCQAFLSATVQPSLDFEKYELRIDEISRQLQTQHEKFCPWPDFPCPERVWVVPGCEPSALLASFLQRFHSTCLLAQQLPALKPEQLKAMSLTEDVVSVMLQLIEEKQMQKGDGACSAPLAVQVAACIVALCGWAASPSQCSMNLPILTCSYCKRKVGLWNFHQMEETARDVETVPNPVGTSGPGTTSPAPVTHEGQGDGAFPATTATTPSRMKLRSQDTTRSDQGEGASFSPQALRTKSRDSVSPTDELPSPRGKRPATRKAQGAAPPSVKRLCLSSAGPDDLLHKTVFDPLAQHRDWCPWVAVGRENLNPGPGWKAALDLLLPLKKNCNTTGSSPGQARDKSQRVFAIFRQWQVTPQA